MVVGNTRSGLTISANASKRGSGIGTTPVFGPIVPERIVCRFDTGFG